MHTMAENVIAAGAENRPPLEKGMYDSWKTRILLYIEGMDNGEMLIDSIHNELKDLTPKEKLRKSCDIKATNTILLGLPIDIYTIVNHHKIAKYIWDRVKELMKGTEITKQERESKLYDDFDRFTFEKGVSIYSYYLRFAKNGVENIDQFLNGFTQPPNEIDMDDLKPDDESVDTPLVSPFLDSDDDSDDGEVLNELEEYGNA
ncbi:hypothetical protein Tco_0487205 [Tanacetum coccineum]